jgi:competence protein ComEC
MHISKKDILTIAALIIIALTRYFFFIPVPPDYSTLEGTVVSFDGVIADSPDVRLNKVHLAVTPLSQDTHIEVVVPTVIMGGPDVSYGDYISVKGIIERPENFMTNSGKEFNYIQYLANQDIYYIVRDAHVEIKEHHKGTRIKELLFRFRDLFIKNIEKVILPPESDLASGLLLGARGGFDETMRNEFISTGTIHIIALSGYNVTIVAEGVMKVLGIFFATTLSLVFGIVVVLLFIVMAGASSTAIRAGIMAVIALLGRMTSRTYNAGRALCIAGLCMIAYDLRVLTDISFQLSFLATFGVLFVTPKVNKYIQFIPARFGFRDLISTTIAATITVLPTLVYTTGVLSLVSLPANILILPFIPITMLVSFISGILGFISHTLSFLFGYGAHLLLFYILSVIHFFGTLSFASVTIQRFPLIMTIILYLILIWWVFKKELPIVDSKS